jgi:hypothetical protein
LLAEVARTVSSRPCLGCVVAVEAETRGGTVVEDVDPVDWVDPVDPVLWVAGVVGVLEAVLLSSVSPVSPEVDGSALDWVAGGVMDAVVPGALEVGGSLDESSLDPATCSELPVVGVAEPEVESDWPSAEPASAASPDPVVTAAVEASGSVRLAGACWDEASAGVSADAVDPVTAIDATSATTPISADAHRQADFVAPLSRRCLDIASPHLAPKRIARSPYLSYVP